MKFWPDAALVHTRLSIIDLTSSGAQPMSNEDGTVWTVFNGEIYNHRELRRKPESRGHTFRGHSDSEILPHLYEEEGIAFAERLRGMFALAIYDRRKRTLLLVRDRFGIKPLFYAAGPGRLAFASEINALRQLPDIDLRPDPQAIYDFSALFYIPAPETFHAGIRALQPGEILEAKLDSEVLSWKTRRYHSWTIAPDPTLNLTRASQRTEELVATGVRRQLESDVPLGALLSGGIDSSLVSAAAQKSLAGKLRTFNVRFPEKEYDETWAALAVAKHIGSRHETLDMNGIPGTWEHVTDLLRHAGQPYADTSLFASHAVCRRMRQHVTVALSGDGGDEGFGGYPFYWQIARIAHWQILPVPMWQWASIASMPFVSWGIISDRFPRRLRDFAGADDVSIVQSMLCWLRERDHANLWSSDVKVSPIRRLFEQHWEYALPHSAPRVERLCALVTEANTRVVLANDFLFKVDTASMKEGLEVRVPMLDEDLFSFALTLPYHLKVQGRTCKRVLRAVAQRWLPAEVATKPKMGFGIPVDRWVDSDFKERLREALLGSKSRLPEYFALEVYRPMVEAFCNGHPCPGISRQGLYQRVIMLLSVQLALDRNGV
jgi:asparagine synthase (glutamine-hydrolysing)